MNWPHKDLIAIQNLTADEIGHVLDMASSFKEISKRDIKKVPTLRGKTVVLLFYEPSTRTRLSFEIAAKRLSADTVALSASGSSFSKGETIMDAAYNVMAMAPDCIVIRYPSAGIPAKMAELLSCSVINGGDGFHEHPTQALLDMYSLKEHFGRIEGLTVAIVGDIMHSRVARSNVYGLVKMGARVVLVAPKTLLPPGVELWGASVTNELDPVIPEADAVMMLRVQNERLNERFFSGAREYSIFYGLNRKRVEMMKDGAVIMHPGPMNRGVEITHDAADSARSIILDQVENGVAVRMTLLYLSMGGTANVD
ncbi:MAG: Aspartate carbamoyltransferase [Deltaproteobacteria bacterium ADurb.BinA179]|jgi:aspartate carbamoyltransferase catalytic subunit|nr:MAG: Aspartate carbamoyltransferase [Deltaproteobacteria bacterium ADurb.BinA179]HOS28770.1 aspartate carbamoyltransferase catalytic subunit [Deltaproteobacteria bacterium]HRR20986.1 aspartate carbamoyltransferase catalytic subunit [Desulfomonilia bacterium]HRR68686.1 aspartate carbamoyltransferase catalytic subunit [Desulfomonilia bacterium]